MKQRNTYWIKLAGYLSGEMPRDQQQQFLGEVRQDATLNNEFETMKKTWNEFSSNPSEKYRDTRKAWSMMKERIESEGISDEETKQTAVVPLRTRIYRTAALIALLLAVGIPTLYFGFTGKPASGESVSHQAEDGVLTVDLPDGSRVYLNKGSCLDYSPDYIDDRKVQLKGEGYFDVMADPEKPFRVNAGKVVVTVLGTSFNIREVAERDKIEVYVESGSVEMSEKESGEKLLLEPGDLGLASEQLEIMPQADANYLSWKTREFKFVDEPVENIIGVLEKSYHVNVETSKVSLEDRILTTSYNEQSFDAILSTICAALNLDYEKDGKVYTLHTK